MEQKKWSQTRLRKAGGEGAKRTRPIAGRRRLTDTAERLLALDHYCLERTGSSALRPDIRLLCFIIVNQSVSIKEALLDSALSYRAFYNMLDRLKKQGLIGIEIDGEDGRVRRIVLGSQFEKLMGKLPQF